MATTTAKMLSKNAKDDANKDTSMGSKAKTPVKKTSAKKTAPKKNQDVIIVTSQEVETLTKVKALTMAAALVEAAGLNEFKIGGVLSVIQANAFWEGTNDKDGTPYDSFKDFVESEYGLQYRKAMYWVAIYNHLVESGVEWAKVADVGWTKLKEIASIITPENVDEWVTRCKELTTIQLIEFIKAYDADSNSGDESGDEDSGTKSSTTNMSFKVHSDQRETIQAALDKAMKAGSTDVATVALEYVCMNYLEGSVGKVKKAAPPSLKDVVEGADLEELLNIIGEQHPEYDITVTEAGEPE